MKPKALTLVEALIVAVISVSLLGVITGIALTGRHTWIKNEAYIDLQEKTRLSMDRLVKELSLSKPTEVTIYDCEDDYQCYGDYIKFKVPVATGGTIYNAEGEIKWGANGVENEEIKYLVMKEGPNDHRFLRITPDAPVPPTGACCLDDVCSEGNQESCGGTFYSGATCDPSPCGSAPTGACCKDYVCAPDQVEAVCIANGGIYQGDHTTCTPPPCGSPPGCFLSGTPILMADGTTKPIEKINLGDKILAFDEKTGKLVEDKVSIFFEHQADEYLVVNSRLKVTANHPVNSEGKWIEIGKLKVGDKLLNAQGKPEEITNIEVAKEPVKVYNLEVNPFHTYIAGGIVVHNKPPGQPPTGEGWGMLKIPYDLLRKFFFDAFAFADEISILAEDIKELIIVGKPDLPAAPEIITITINAERKSMMGETIQTSLTSSVTLRN